MEGVSFLSFWCLLTFIHKMQNSRSSHSERMLFKQPHGWRQCGCFFDTSSTRTHSSMDPTNLRNGLRFWWKTLSQEILSRQILVRGLEGLSSSRVHHFQLLSSLHQKAINFATFEKRNGSGCRLEVDSCFSIVDSKVSAGTGAQSGLPSRDPPHQWRWHQQIQLRKRVGSLGWIQKHFDSATPSSASCWWWSRHSRQQGTCSLVVDHGHFQTISQRGDCGSKLQNPFNQILCFGQR